MAVSYTHLFTENVYDRRRSDPGRHDYSLRLGDDRAERSVGHRQQPADKHNDGNPDVKELSLIHIYNSFSDIVVVMTRSDERCSNQSRIRARLVSSKFNSGSSIHRICGCRSISRAIASRRRWEKSSFPTGVCACADNRIVSITASTEQAERNRRAKKLSLIHISLIRKKTTINSVHLSTKTIGSRMFSVRTKTMTEMTAVKPCLLYTSQVWFSFSHSMPQSRISSQKKYVPSGLRVLIIGSRVQMCIRDRL